MPSLLIFPALVILASMFGAAFRPGPWYDELIKPALNPPGWIFTPVWLTLYLMIAVAGWLVWKKVRSIKNPVMILWGAQLVFNALWSWIFFGLERPGLAFADILIIFVLIAGFIRYAWPISRPASLLFMPYFLWVAFASYLNLGIVILN
jgi:translocator protein